MTLVEFLRARLDEDEAAARAASPGPWEARAPHNWQDWSEHLVYVTADRYPGDYREVTPGGGEHGDDGLKVADAALIVRHDPVRVLAEVHAKRRILQWHEAWPVLVQTQPSLEKVGDDPASMAYRMTQQANWLTTAEYRARFGDEPPSTPILLALASVYADHPDFDEAWRS